MLISQYPGSTRETRLESITWSSLVLPKKTSSAIEAGDSEDEDPVPLGAWGWTLSWALAGPQGWLHGLHSDAEIQ